MTLKDELFVACQKIFNEKWETVNKTVIPDAVDLKLGNHAGYFDEMAVLYADLNGSTSMVDKYRWEFSAEVYKAYLHCAAKIIKDSNGFITAYDGDRIMAVFIGIGMDSNAVSAALKINFAIKEIVNIAMKLHYTTTDFVIKHTIGVDRSPIRVARIGVKNDNDLVWIGRAANHAAKLTMISNPNLPIFISDDVHVKLRENLKKFDSGAAVWEARKWNTMDNQLVWGTNANIIMP